MAFLGANILVFKVLRDVPGKQRYHPVGLGTAPIDYCKYTGLSVMAHSEFIMSVSVSSGLWPLLVL